MGRSIPSERDCDSPQQSKAKVKVAQLNMAALMLVLLVCLQLATNLLPAEAGTLPNYNCGSSLFACPHNCWQNDPAHRDARAKDAGMWDRRCRYVDGWGRHCYCYGQPCC